MTTQTEFQSMRQPVVPEPVAAPTQQAERPKKQRKTTTLRARGIIKADIGGEPCTVTMRASGVFVKRAGKRRVDSKPLPEIIDFILGQERLPLGIPNPNYVNASFARRLEREITVLLAFINEEMKMTASDPRISKLEKRIAAVSNDPSSPTRRESASQAH